MEFIPFESFSWAPDDYNLNLVCEFEDTKFADLGKGALIVVYLLEFIY
jgi:hypothetical protein